MPAVSVERTPVRVLHLGLVGFDHLQIVFRPAASWMRQEDWFVMEGVRAEGEAGLHLAVEGWHGGTTLAEANGGRIGAALADRIGSSEARGARVVAEGADAVRAWSTFVAYAAEIDAQKFPYIAVALPASSIPTINSSSLVASLLYYAGFDMDAARPVGLRFSPGMTTLLGTSMDDTMKAGRTFSTLVAGNGNDTLIGSDEIGQVDKMFGGRGNDVFYWSAGLNIVDGGEPGLPTREDGIDTVDYTGVGEMRIEAAPRTSNGRGPEFIVHHAHGEDRLTSIEEIVWDQARDSVSIGAGVAIAHPARPSPHRRFGEDAGENGQAVTCLLPGRCRENVPAPPDEANLDLALDCSLLLCAFTPGGPPPLSDIGYADLGAGS